MGRGSARGRPPLQVPSGLGERIRDHRVRLGLTQEQVGAPVYRGGYISNVEHARVRPSLEAIAHIASRLGVQSTDLIGADAATLVRPEDAMARAAELLAQALSSTPEADRHLISAAVVVLDSLRRQVMR